MNNFDFSTFYPVDVFRNYTFSFSFENFKKQPLVIVVAIAALTCLATYLAKSFSCGYKNNDGSIHQKLNPQQQVNIPSHST